METSVSKRNAPISNTFAKNFVSYNVNKASQTTAGGPQILRIALYSLGPAAVGGVMGWLDQRSLQDLDIIYKNLARNLTRHIPC